VVQSAPPMAVHLAREAVVTTPTGGWDVRHRPFPVALAAGAAAVAICSCGSPTVSGATPTPSAAPPDSCLVGTWKSVSISGGITVAGSRVTLSGGAGELLIITATGSIRTDDSSTAPLTGTASDGSVYKLAQSGTATGTISAAGGRITVTLDQPTPLTVTLSRNGTTVQSQHPGSATDSYMCAAGTSLVITGAGGTVSTYTPG
jgi:molecular chaperone DnaK